MPRVRRSIDNPEDLARLPDWAREGIEVLMRDKESLLKRHTAGPDNSDTFLLGHHVEPDKPLGSRGHIGFGKPTGAHLSFYPLEARWEAENEQLYISTTGGRLQVEPSSSNSCFVRVSKR